jgi:ubiquinone/menaquinone biosynthesis C-methylase UbiE
MSGVIFRWAAPLFARAVTVVDTSRQMLGYAAGRPGVEPVLGDAAALPFADGTFDAALVCDALHHIAEREAAVRELVRVVRVGGAVVIAEADANAHSTRMIGFGERLLGEPAAFMRPSDLQGLMAAVGVPGSTQRRGDASYVFVGSVAPRV